MKNFKSNRTFKYAILFFAFLFILANALSKNNAATFTVNANNPFFPNDQTINGPDFFPFSNSPGVVDLFNQQCPNPTFLFDGPDSLSGSTLEVGPAANDFETGSRNILVFDMNGNVSLDFLNTFPLANPNTMTAFDPLMGDILGLSLVPGAGFPMSATFMIITTFNCDDGMSSSSTSTGGTTTSSSGSTTTTSSSGSTAMSSSSSGSVSSSGAIKTNGQAIASAIADEKSAKKSIHLKDLLKGKPFSVSMAIDDLKSSLSDLQDLSSMLANSDLMLGMDSIQSKVDEAISADNEAIMLLEPLKDTDPSITNGEFTTPITRVNMILSEIIRIKERIEAKINKSEKNEKDK